MTNLELNSFLIGSGGLCAVAFLAITFRSYPIAGAGACIAAHLLTTLNVSLAAQIGDLQISISDIVTVALAGSLALYRRKIIPVDRSLVLLGALLIVACLRGLPKFDLNIVGNGARLLANLLVPAFFGFLILSQHGFDPLRKAWGYAALCVSAVAVAFLTQNGFGTYGTEGVRALDSPQSLVIATWALLVLGGAATRRSAWAACGALLLVLASQQRTVWAATAVGLAVIALKERRAAEPGRRRVAFGIVAGVAVGLPMILMLGPAGFRSSVETAASTVSADSGTFGWRVDGWLDLLRRFQSSDVVDQAIGQPMGTGFLRTVLGTQVAYSPHNMYLTVLLSLGIVGFGALLVTYARALSRTRISRLHPAVWALVVYSVGYQITPPVALLLGLALSTQVLEDQNAPRTQTAR